MSARKSYLARGVAPILLYAALTATLDVYAGNKLQIISPISLAAISFSLTAAFFLGLEIARRGAAAALRPLRTHSYDVGAVNVTTALTWISMLYALKYLEPAVVNVLVLALAPILTVLIGPLLRRGSSATALEAGVSLGICVLLGVLVWGTFSGRSGIGGLDTREGVLGMVSVLACGLGSTANVIYMKRLSDAGHSPRSVLAVRFFLMICVTWVMTLMSESPGLSEALLPAVVVAVIGIAVPIYALQVGIKHTEPITTSLLLSLSPLFAFALQFLDSRLRPSALTFAGILGIVALVLIGTTAGRRRAEPVPAHAGETESSGPRTVPAVTASRQEARVMRCAIVDAYGAGRLLPGALRRHGVDYLHIRSEYPDTHLAYRPEDFTTDIAHNGVVDETAALLRQHGVGFVVAGAESGVLLADRLSAALGTPGNGMARPAARRDKYQMVTAVREAGLLVADSFVSSSAEEIVGWARSRGEWPIVLKPVASAGTDNVVLCNSTDDVRAAHARIMASTDRYGRHNERVLAQEYLAGEEHYANTVSRDGTHRIVEIWRYHKRTVAGGRPIYDYETLLSHDDPVARRIGEYTLAVLDALEIRNSAAHTEVMLTERGPVLIECGARLGGGQMPDVLTRCIGTDQVDRLAFSIARPDEFVLSSQELYRPLTHLWCVNLISLCEGTVPSAEGWAPVKALDSFAGMVLNRPEGSTAPPTVDLATSPGYLYLSSNDADVVEADYARLRELERISLYD